MKQEARAIFVSSPAPQVEEMTASRPEDVEAILSKIRADVGYASFNRTG